VFPDLIVAQLTPGEDIFVVLLLLKIIHISNGQSQLIPPLPLAPGVSSNFFS